MRLWLQPGDDLVAMVRAADADSVTVSISPTLDPLALTLAKAAIAPLAIEQSARARVNAVVLGATGRVADAEAVIAFLESARSTTGQVLEIS